MWPRLLVQLVELLPHATRLLPLADNYFTTRRETDGKQAAAFATMSDGLREEINGISSHFPGLSRQLLDQQKQITELQDSLEAAETHRITQTKQLEWITTDLNALRAWVKFGVVAILLLLVALFVLTFQLLRLR